MLVMLLMLVGDPDVLIARARAQLAIVRCPVDGAGSDVMVCGRRHADRFRVPLKTMGDTELAQGSNAAGEREALLHRTTPIEDLGPFLVGGGFAGVSAGVGIGPGAGSGKTSITGERPLAP